MWHGDTTESHRNRIRNEPPDILLTTPESLEAMLIGIKTDHHDMLGGIRAVVVDEVHAFAGDDRGWHLLAVLERLEGVTGGPIQRIGLSATVGNPDELLTWLQGSGARVRRGRIIAPDLLLTATFTAPPQFTVLAGRQEIGRSDPSILTDDRPGPRLLLLAGQSWRVTEIDWARKRVFVEPADSGGVAKWSNLGVCGLSHALTRAMRDALLGADPPVSLTRRARANLAEQRKEKTSHTVTPRATTITRADGTLRWWTWAGYRANATVAATLSAVADPGQRPTDFAIPLRSDLTMDTWRVALADTGDGEKLTLPAVDPRAAKGLKFSDVLPENLSAATVSARLADLEGARAVLREKVCFRLHGS